ncbi:MAG: Lrp/AsnC family transcriptional regulator [Promethearchaeota archaeon]
MTLLLQEIKAPHKIDVIDKALMRYLEKNPSATYDEMAQHIGKAKGTVHNRLEQLKKNKLIQPAYIIDYEKLGFDDAMIEIRVDVGKIHDVSAYLKTIPEIICIYHITGDYDILAMVRFRGREHLNEILETINKHEKIFRTNSSLILLHLKGSAIDLPEREVVV